MTNLERCPDCFHLPEVTFEDNGYDKARVILTCTQPNHVHQAIGETLEGSQANWNLYCMLLRNQKEMGLI